MTNRLTTEQKTCIEMNMQQFQERISKIVEDANNYKFKTNKPLEIFSLSPRYEIIFFILGASKQFNLLINVIHILYN